MPKTTVNTVNTDAIWEAAGKLSEMVIEWTMEQRKNKGMGKQTDRTIGECNGLPFDSVFVARELVTRQTLKKMARK
jgi:hypothetical protein